MSSHPSNLASNPFVNKGKIIDNPSDFFGRTDDIRTIFEYIRAGQSVSIVGSRRIGKSSLLRQLCHLSVRHPDLQDNYLFVRIDCQLISDDKTGEDITPASFYQFLQEKTTRELNKHNSVINGDKTAYLSFRKRWWEWLFGKKESEPLNHTFSGFQHWLENTIPVNYHVVFLFDEFEKLATSPQLNESFFTQLRGMGEQSDVIYVTASQIKLYDLSFYADAVLTSPFFNIFSPLELGFFKLSEAVHLLTTLSASESYFRFNKSDLDFVIQWAGLHPAFIQITAFHLFVEKVQTHNGTLSEAAYTRVKQASNKELKEHYEHIWNNLPLKEQEALISIYDDDSNLISTDIYERLHEKCILRDKKIFANSFAIFVKQKVDSYKLSKTPQTVNLKSVPHIEGDIRPAHRPILRELLQDEPVENIKTKRLSGGYANFGIYHIRLRYFNDSGDLLARVLKFAPASDINSERDNYKYFIEKRLRIAVKGIIKWWFPPGIEQLDKSEWRHEMAASMYDYAVKTGDSVDNLHGIYTEWMQSDGVEKKIKSRHDPIQKTLQRLFKALDEWQTRYSLGHHMPELTQEYLRLRSKLDRFEKSAVTIPQLKLDRKMQEFGRFRTEQTFSWNKSTYVNPIHWVMKFFTQADRIEWLENIRTSYRVGFVHGDLNFRNVLIETEAGKLIDSIWLVDFADTHVGHPLRDYGNLEADLKFFVTVVNEKDFEAQENHLSSIIALERALLEPSERSRLDLQRTPLPYPCRGNLKLKALWTYTRQIRAKARADYVKGTDLRPYYFSLLHATLPLIYYDTINEWQQLYAFLSAAMICEKIDDLSDAAGQERVMPKP
ncbi:MAG: AAA-like domain-containing protein [Anaerolineales bacterium]|nr:AAA-like domain-containing protein [Anaerolineales bacterium]